MTTLAALRTRVANRTRRGSETDFATIVNDAFATFLATAGQLRDFDEMRSTVSAVFAADDTSSTLASATLTGFLPAIHHLFGQARVGLTDGSQFNYPIDIKRLEWIDARFPDRLRSSAISQQPAYCALRGTTIHLQAPSRDAYTITISSSHLPDPDFASNPIPSLDEALVSWASYEIYEATEQYDASSRQWEKAQILLDRAVKSDEQPGVLHQAIPRSQFFVAGGDGGYGCDYRFNLSDLQGIYPDT